MAEKKKKRKITIECSFIRNQYKVDFIVSGHNMYCSYFLDNYCYLNLANCNGKEQKKNTK